MDIVNRETHILNLDRYFPPTVATMEVPNIITHIKRLHRSDAMSLHRPLESLFYCMKVVEVLHGMYSGVDLVVPFALALLRRANVGVLTTFDSKVQELNYQGSRYTYGDFQPPVLASDKSVNGISSSQDHNNYPPGSQSRSAYGLVPFGADARSAGQMHAAHSLVQPGSAHHQQGGDGEGSTEVGAASPDLASHQALRAINNDPGLVPQTYSQTQTQVQPAWNCQDDIFLTTGVDYECLFGHFMVDFDNLDYMDMGASGGLGPGWPGGVDGIHQG